MQDVNTLNKTEFGSKKKEPSTTNHITTVDENDSAFDESNEMSYLI